jgi:hypothetical protein
MKMQLFIPNFAKNNNSIIMKALSLFILFFLLLSHMEGKAQVATIKQSPVLFGDFTVGSVLLKNGKMSKVALNYDCVNQEMHFLQNGERLILDNPETIEAVIVGDRRFVPNGDHFLEVINFSDCTLYIDWKTKIANRGKKGAMGFVTHGGTIKEIDVDLMQHNTPEYKDTNVYEIISQNKYYLSVGGEKMKKFSTLKAFCKLYPKEKEASIRKFASTEKLGMKKPEQIYKLVRFASSL